MLARYFVPYRFFCYRLDVAYSQFPADFGSAGVAANQNDLYVGIEGLPAFDGMVLEHVNMSHERLERGENRYHNRLAVTLLF
jgi:hypothetical protein